MKYLGVDYGQKKIGIAISNDEATMAFPRDIVPNDEKHIEYIKNLCKSEGIKDIVIGKSVDYEGKDNTIEKHVKKFISELDGFIIHRIDERLSTSLINAENRFHFQKKQTSKTFSKNAKSVRETTKNDDAKVAAIILQNFLDSKPKV